MLDEEALFREARRHRRRRWAIGFLVFAALLGGSAAVAALITSGNRAHATTKGGGTAGGLPTGALASLNVAGPLAVAPDGALYVADVARDRVLVRLPDGRFRVVAGNGKVGFSGDGGRAVRAELSGVSDLVFAPNGTLYIADGGRVRVIRRDGVIRTIAGDNRAGQTIANGTPALSAALGSTHSIRVSGTPLSIALSPAGQLYISTGSQILRLAAIGALETVRSVITSGPLKGQPLNGFGPIAVDANGNIDVAGVNGWSVWQLAAGGVAHEVGFARRSGGDYAVLQPGPGGGVYSGNGNAVLRVETRKLARVFEFDKPVYGQIFFLTYFALSPDGTIYADDIPGGGGFEAHQQLRSVSNSRVSLLWQESSATPK